MHEHDESELILIYATLDLAEDSVVTAALDDNGVPYVKTEDHGDPYPAPATQGYSHICTLEEHAKRAHEVISAALDGKDIPPPTKRHQALGPDDRRRPDHTPHDVGQSAHRRQSR